MIMVTDYNLKLGSYEVICMYANVDKPANLHIYTHHKKVSTYLTSYNILWRTSV
jgi:hypothetical protein